MFSDGFSLGGFLGGLDDTLQEAGLGGTEGALGLWNDSRKSSNQTNTSNATVRKYEQIQQKSTPTPTATTSPLDNKMLIYGGVGLVALILIMKR